MTELMVQRRVPPIDYQRKPRVPASYQPRVLRAEGKVVRVFPKISAVCRTLGECSELVKWYGDAAFAPYLPVLVNAPAGWTAITGLGYASAAELQDCAVALWTRQADKLARMGCLFDYDALRERHGLMRREDADAAIREALRERVRKHKANPVSDPFRQMQYDNPNERAVFAVDGLRERKET